MKVSIYDVASGLVQQHSAYPDHIGSDDDILALVRAELGEGLDVVPEHIDAAAYLILDGHVVDRPPEVRVVLPYQVKAEAERRIIAEFGPPWKQINAIRAGADLSGIDLIRDASNRIEAMGPIPLDFKDHKYWKEMP